MNDKINALLDELKQEIDAYVQAEVARLTDSGTAVEASTAETSTSEAPIPAEPVKVEFGSDLPAPEMQTPAVDNSNSTVAVPPMPEPTAVPETSVPFTNDVNTDLPDPGEPMIAPGQETRDFSEQTVFADNQVTDQQGESFNENQADSFAAPQSAPPEAAVDLTAFEAAQDVSAPAVPDFVMPTEVNSSVEAAAGPLPDLNPSTAPADLPTVTPVEDLPAAPAEPELPQAEPAAQPQEEAKGFDVARGLLGKVLNKKWGSKT
ncbi:MAG: hypothetical protein Q4G02_02030 [bacterium]|nr:hypothetical protein [bacterium]